MEVHRSVEKISWAPHPTAQGVMIKPLITRKEYGLDVTCMIVNVMWVEGTGSFSLEPGVIVQVPKGTKHKIVDVTDDLLLYDVFCPALM